MIRWFAILPLLWPALLIGLGDAYVLTQYRLACLFPPVWTARSLGLVALIAANLVLAASMAWQIGQLARFFRRSRRLDRLDVAQRERLALPELARVDVRVIALDAPMLVTAGGLRPVIVVSRWMLDRLDPRELRAAFAHELAHIQHHDAQLMLVLQGLCPGGFGLEGLRRGLEGIRRELELRADAIAASRVADPLAVASALVKVGRAARPRVPAVAFADRPLLLQDRIAALLEGPSSAQEPRFGEKLRVMLLGLGSLAVWLAFVGHLCVGGLV